MMRCDDYAFTEVFSDCPRKTGQGFAATQQQLPMPQRGMLVIMLS